MIIYHPATNQPAWVTSDPREAVEMANTLALFQQLRSRGAKGTARELRKAHGPQRVDWSLLSTVLNSR